MKNPCIFLIALAIAGAAQAQNYKWIENGKTRYGDTPPPGVKATALTSPESGPAAASPAAASKDAKKGPLSGTEKDQASGRRQAAGGKGPAQPGPELQAKAKKAEDCAGLREHVRTLDSGKPVSRTDAAGKDYYLNEGQIMLERMQAKRTLRQVCTY